MARKVGATRSYVITEAHNIDLGDAAGDVTLGILCPGDGAKVVSCAINIRTAGTGAAANHQLVLEHGLGAAGVALTGQIDLDADGAAGTIVSGGGLPFPSQPATVLGTVCQFNNTESASITDGAFVDVSVLWQL